MSDLWGLLALVGVISTVFLFAVGWVVIVRWIRFPFTVETKLNEIIRIQSSLLPMKRVEIPEPPALEAPTTEFNRFERITCKCNTCSGVVQFKREDAGQLTTCPHCQMETTLYIPPVSA